MSKVTPQSVVDMLVQRAQVRKETDAEMLDQFFGEMEQHSDAYKLWTGEVPKTLVINPEIVGKLSRFEGFYQRKELKALVPAHAPVVRNLRLAHGVVFILEDLDEPFYHFEG